MVESSAKVKPWRQDVKAATLDAYRRYDTAPMVGPVAVTVTFFLRRPAYHYGTGRNANLLRLNAPDHVSKKPDIDKLLRSTLDGLTEAGVWRDDSQVAQVTAAKLYSSKPGAHIAVETLEL